MPGKIKPSAIAAPSHLNVNDSMQLINQLSSHKPLIVSHDENNTRSAIATVKRGFFDKLSRATYAYNRGIKRTKQGKILRRKSVIYRDRERLTLTTNASDNESNKMDRHNILYRKNVIQLGAKSNIVRNEAEKTGSLQSEYDFWSRNEDETKHNSDLPMRNIHPRKSVPTINRPPNIDYILNFDNQHIELRKFCLSACDLTRAGSSSSSGSIPSRKSSDSQLELNHLPTRKTYHKITLNNNCNNEEFHRTREKQLNDKLARILLHDKNYVRNSSENLVANFTPGKKKFFSPIGKWRAKKYTHTDIRIQQIDGGFFERFGSLFREGSEIPGSSPHKSPLAPIPSVENESIEDNVMEMLRDDGEEANGGRAGSEADSGVDSLADVDSDPEEGVKTDIIEDATGWNIDELYSEILFEILHNVGCDANYEMGQEALFNYVEDAFKMPNDKHTALLAAAEKKEAPEILLNVEVIEGKDLMPKDANGLSDPFVTLYLQSSPSHRYNTSVKSATLNPTWEEHFSLPISESTPEDTLCMEVWDFDPAETVREKMSKFSEIRGVKGFRKLVKEIAITASTGQHDNELIGRANIPLKTIPASGMTMWYSLDKKNKLKRQGVIRVRLAYSSQKQPRVAAQEHRHLLKILLIHELETSKVNPNWWCGKFSTQAEAILTQHAAQSGLGLIEQALVQWSVYCSVHTEYPLSFLLFTNILDKLIKPLQGNTICEEEVKIFWEATKKLLPSVFYTIRKIRKKTAGDKSMLKQVLDALRIIAKLSLLEPPEKTDLFPNETYPWLTFKTEEPNWDIRGTLADAVTQGASDWFEHIIENNGIQDMTDESKMQLMIKIVHLVRSDLQRAVEYYDKIFQEVVNFQYATSLYLFYEKRIAVLVEPEVMAICKSLKRLRFDEMSTNNNEVNEPLAQGTTLFELYLVLQRFVALGVGLCPTNNELQVKEFYKWFHGGVAQWLDIAVYKALQRIEKAVELDSLIPVSSELKYSSSAVDTLTIFYQIKVFWQQLNWPDVEGCYTFVAKIIDDICRCSVFYADKMAARVDGMGDVSDIYEKKFEVTKEWCLAINNIDYVRQSLQPFVSELNMEAILQKLSDVRSTVEAERCRQTLNNVIENAIDTVRNKIIELLETLTKKMAPAMKRLLIEGAELNQQDSNSIDRALRYMDNNLAMLNDQLNGDNFQRILEIVWSSLADILQDIIKTNIEKRRPPSFYSNLNETLKIMVGSFKRDDAGCECNEIKKVEQLLALNGMETAELIHNVHLERWREQQQFSSENAPFGQLTVRCKFHDSKLHIEVMNARNLVAMDSNGLSDSFVRIHFLPEEKFLQVPKPKTHTHSKNLFPLYDETFNIPLTADQRGLNDGLIMFSIKDKDFLGMANQYLAEAYIHFKEIPDTPESLESLPQVILVLSRPKLSNLDAVRVLETRQGDKHAREFIKKFRSKVGSAVPQ